MGMITGFKQNTEYEYSLEMVFDNKYIFQYEGSTGVTIFDHFDKGIPLVVLKFEKKNFQMLSD